MHRSECTVDSVDTFADDVEEVWGQYADEPVMEAAAAAATALRALRDAILESYR